MWQSVWGCQSLFFKLKMFVKAVSNLKTVRSKAQIEETDFCLTDWWRLTSTIGA
jgi:hypothetical protein